MAPKRKQKKAKVVETPAPEAPPPEIVETPMEVEESYEPEQSENPATKKIKPDIPETISDLRPPTPELVAHIDPPIQQSISEPLSDDDDEIPVRPVRSIKTISTSSLYLDTIQRIRLDFDFEKLCCVSLENINVYACLVCGKYYKGLAILRLADFIAINGRGKESHAYFHSMNEDHHVYILPDGYEVIDPTLHDIKYVLRPTFSKLQVDELDKMEKYSYDLNGKRYLPGFVGLNNIKSNDYVNVLVQAFAHVKPLRDHFLLHDLKTSSELVNRFGMLIRKMWNPRAFKGQVSPHEFLQEISNASAKRFKLTEQSDPTVLLSWLLNHMHKGLFKKTAAGPTSIIHQIFQGELMIEEQKLASGTEKQQSFDENREITVKVSPFMFLTLDLPNAPLYQDELEKNIIPQVPIVNLLAKYDGKTFQEIGQSIKRHKITKLPPFLIFHVKRFSKNNFSFQREKNPTIVNFPLGGLDMKEYASVEGETRFDLVANVLHEGKPDGGVYKVFLRGCERWFQVQDLFVDETDAHVILLAESYIQIWQRRDVK
ncbi:hypothetical protein HK096_002762 [Nowakowskiella sp. JEL0078]|nr:hypothetical protein HK096_002762 [Nowakowskiella sp. JEL0078]